MGLECVLAACQEAALAGPQRRAGTSRPRRSRLPASRNCTLYICPRAGLLTKVCGWLQALFFSCGLGSLRHKHFHSIWLPAMLCHCHGSCCKLLGEEREGLTLGALLLRAAPLLPGLAAVAGAAPALATLTIASCTKLSAARHCLRVHCRGRPGLCRGHGLPQLSREDVLLLTKAARPSLKLLRVSACCPSQPCAPPLQALLLMHLQSGQGWHKAVWRCNVSLLCRVSPLLVQVSRPGSLDDEYTLERQSVGWALPCWARGGLGLSASCKY